MKHRKLSAACAAWVLAGVLACSGCAGGGQDSPLASAPTTALDPAVPVQVEFWTYYSGAQQQAFEDFTKEFNATRGKEIGVVVTGLSQGGVTNLASEVTNSAQELVGSDAMPDAFLSYPDTASIIDGFGCVADLSQYLTDKEKAEYVESFLAEGDLTSNGSLKVFPVAKSTETLQINMTDWASFAVATGSAPGELATIEGITAVSKRYYEWTDAQTPAVVGDGLPFFGRDSLANYFIAGSRQLDSDILTVDQGVGTFNLDRATMKKLWDNYYIPMVQGWFSAEGKFRSDAVKTGNLICYVGSSSSVVYFPKVVTVDDSTSYPIEMGALANPAFEGATPCAPQQGAGFVVTKADGKKEEACVEFLKWFTEKQQNTRFSISAGYVPVKKEALEIQNFEAVVASGVEVPQNYMVNLPATLETIEQGVYANLPFKGGVEARVVLERTLSDKAVADRKAVVAAVESGVAPEAAVEPFLQDAVFDAWLTDLTGQLEATVQ